MRKFRKKVKQVHQLAAALADRCNFTVAEEIATAFFDFGEDFAIANIQVRDQVEVTQIMCAFVFGATMTGLGFEIDRSCRHGVTVALEKENKQEVK